MFICSIPRFEWKICCGLDRGEWGIMETRVKLQTYKQENRGEGRTISRRTPLEKAVNWSFRSYPMLANELIAWMAPRLLLSYEIMSS